MQQLWEILAEHRLSYFWIAWDLIIWTLAIRFVLISTRFKKKWLWVLASIFNPLLILIFGSGIFKNKILWVTVLIIFGGMKINVGTPQYFYLFPVPLNFSFNYGFSLGALIVLGYWVFGIWEKMAERSRLAG
jgi:hypothetical protein